MQSPQKCVLQRPVYEAQEGLLPWGSLKLLLGSEDMGAGVLENWVLHLQLLPHVGYRELLALDGHMRAVSAGRGAAGARQQDPCYVVSHSGNDAIQDCHCFQPSGVLTPCLLLYH
jgi:hypothetical protein